MSLPEPGERILYRCDSQALTCGEQNHLEGFVTLRVSASVSLGWGTIMCVFNKFPSDADTAGPRYGLGLAPSAGR